MDYITLANLAEKPGAVELAQATAQDGRAYADPELLDLMLRGGDVSAYPPEQVDIGETAVGVIREAITDAQNLIDGFLRQRGHRLPLAVVPRQLAVWSRAIVRYSLHPLRQSQERDDPIVRDYKIALDFLQKVAAGKYSLGIDDTQKPQGGPPRHTGPGRTFSMNTLKDFGK